MNYSKKRASQQLQASSLKYTEIPVNTTLKLVDVIPGEIKQNNQMVPNDVLITETAEGKKIKVSVREFLKMNVQDGTPHYKSEDSSDDVKLPSSITVIASKGREDRDGNPVFPVGSYELASEFFAEGSTMTWDVLVAGGLRKDNPFKQVQDFTIAIN